MSGERETQNLYGWVCVCGRVWVWVAARVWCVKGGKTIEFENDIERKFKRRLTKSPALTNATKNSFLEKQDPLLDRFQDCYKNRG